MHREPKTIASRPCTPPSTLEMFGEKISASPGSSKEIAGLLRKMMMMKMTKSRMSGFSRGKLEAGRIELGLCTARYELLLVCFEGLARLSRRVWRHFVRVSREISLRSSLHRASTDALIV